MKQWIPITSRNYSTSNRTAVIADLYKPYRIYPDHLAEAAKNSVILFRPSMQIDVERAACLEEACLVYSMWDGYLAEDKMKPFLAWLDGHGIPMHKCHTSGHASLHDLKRLRNAFGSTVVVPVHCAEPKVFAMLFDRVTLHADDDPWEIA
jgi:ribonuclease J